MKKSIRIDEINENLLEDGVSLKTEDVNSEIEALESLPENGSAGQRDTD